jgi:YegS/Rv2252/BmrU family lipid kinase
LFIVNPHSRGGKTEKLWKKYLTKIESNYKYDFDYLIANGIGSGWEASQNAIDDGHDTLIAVGGEGTANEIVNGIYFSKKPDLKLGFIQSGTVNDYQQVIQWPKDIDQQIDSLNVAHTKNTPVTYVKGDKERVSLNVADTGIGATIAYAASVERRLKWIKSGFRYTLLSLRAITKWKNKTAKITLDDRYIEGDLSLLMSGFSSQSGDFKVLPHADPWGSKMAYTVAMGFSKLAMVKLMGVLKKGEHTEDIDGVYMGHADKITIETEEPMIFETDGEPFSYDSTEIEVKSIPNAINVIQSNSVQSR